MPPASRHASPMLHPELDPTLRLHASALRRSRLALTLAALAIVAAVTARSAAAVGGGLVRHATGVLETRFLKSDIAAADPVAGIVVLGGHVERAREAVRLASRHPAALVVLSGPGAEEEALLGAAPGLEGRLLIDRRPQTTYENAIHSRPLTALRPDGRWLLVTSALHMPRSVGAFRAAGLAVTPWPVADTPAEARWAATRLQHEVIGLFYYRMLGRTDALLPGARL